MSLLKSNTPKVTRGQTEGHYYPLVTSSHPTFSMGFSDSLDFVKQRWYNPSYYGKLVSTAARRAHSRASSRSYYGGYGASAQAHTPYHLVQSRARAWPPRAGASYSGSLGNAGVDTNQLLKLMGLLTHTGRGGTSRRRHNCNIFSHHESRPRTSV